MYLNQGKCVKEGDYAVNGELTSVLELLHQILLLSRCHRYGRLRPVYAGNLLGLGGEPAVQHGQ